MEVVSITPTVAQNRGVRSRTSNTLLLRPTSQFIRNPGVDGNSNERTFDPSHYILFNRTWLELEYGVCRKEELEKHIFNCSLPPMAMRVSCDSTPGLRCTCCSQNATIPTCDTQEIIISKDNITSVLDRNCQSLFVQQSQRKRRYLRYRFHCQSTTFPGYIVFTYLL